MAKRLKQAPRQQDETLVDLVEVRDQAQDFFERNQKYILGGLIALVVIIGGIFVYRNFVQGPQQQTAMSAMYMAQRQFERDSFQLALLNPGGANQLGFDEIVRQYGGTPAGNLARYYAGVSYLNLGQFDAAISFLEEFKPDGDITPVMKFGTLGDAHSEKGDLAKAEDLYNKAVNAADDNDLLASYYLKKLGMLYEYQQQPAEALKAYQRLKDEFPLTPFAQDIDKYIARVTPKG